MKAPFPWYGGKSKIAEVVWSRFGTPENYVEPFYGSGAVLLCRPDEPQTETINDADGLLANFWRALKADPDAVAEHADNPVNENDLHARHIWLVERKDSLQAKLEGDPDFYDAKTAGWWCWGLCCWIGSGWCSGRGPWSVREIDGVRQLVDLGDQGRGVNRKRVHLGDQGVGVNRKRLQLGGWADKGINARSDLIEYFHDLATRLRRVHVCCGDWSRVCGPSVTIKHGTTAVFLDPPYSDKAGRATDLYRKDCLKVSHAVREWAIVQGDNPLFRIALCGYAGEYEMPVSWEVFEWNAGEGYGGQAAERSGNGKKERVWFSPNCIKDVQKDLFK